jgi:hypothetical protein
MWFLWLILRCLENGVSFLYFLNAEYVFLQQSIPSLGAALFDLMKSYFDVLGL